MAFYSKINKKKINNGYTYLKSRCSHLDKGKNKKGYSINLQ